MAEHDGASREQHAGPESDHARASGRRVPPHRSAANGSRHARRDRAGTRTIRVISNLRGCIEARPWLQGLLLAGLVVAIALPGVFRLPVTDRDEARFAQASRQMVEAGDWVRIYFQDEPRSKKPVGVYWLQAACALAAGAVQPTTTGTGDATPTPATATAASAARDGPPIWPFRLPSVAGATIAGLGVWLLGRLLFDARTGCLAAAMLACCPLLVIEAHLAKSDAALLATVVLAHLALAHLDPRGAIAGGGRGPRPRSVAGGPRPGWTRWGWPLVLWVALGLGVLIKGPMTPLVVGLTLLTLVVRDVMVRAGDGHPREVLVGWWRALRPLIGTGLLIAIAGPWFVAAWVTTDGAFFRDSVGGDLLPKIIGGHESHGGPPGLHLVLLPALFFPGSLFTLGALCYVRRRRGRRQRELTFLMAWLVPAWIVFELVPTKLPHYPLPLYPAVALVTARYLLLWARHWRVARARADGRAERLPRPRLEPGLTIWRVIGGALAVAVPTLVLLVPDGEGGRSVWGVAAAVGVALAAGGLAAGVGGSLASTGARAVAGMAVALAGSATALVLTLAVALPAVRPIWPARVIEDEIARLRHDAALERPLSAIAAGEEVRAPAVTAAAPPWRLAASVGLHEPSLVFAFGTHLRLPTVRSSLERFAMLQPGELMLIPDDRLAAWQAALAEAYPGELPRVQAVGRPGRVFNVSKGEWVSFRLYTRLAEIEAGGTAAPSSVVPAANDDR